jgi:hypothetical protein
MVRSYINCNFVYPSVKRRAGTGRNKFELLACKEPTSSVVYCKIAKIDPCYTVAILRVKTLSKNKTEERERYWSTQGDSFLHVFF